MKSFPFYRVLSNWFAPFSIHHPGIAQAQREIGNSKMIHGLLGRSPMCDSDKYSLVLALGEIIDRIPANLRDAMRAAGGQGGIGLVDLRSPTVSTESLPLLPPVADAVADRGLLHGPKERQGFLLLLAIV